MPVCSGMKSTRDGNARSAEIAKKQIRQKLAQVTLIKNGKR